MNTPPKFNIAPENQWLDNLHSFGKVTFQGRADKLRGCKWYMTSSCRMIERPLNPIHVYYFWWKKSWTSWYGLYPIIYRDLYIPAGCLGFSSINSSSSILLGKKTLHMQRTILIGGGGIGRGPYVPMKIRVDIIWYPDYLHNVFTPSKQPCLEDHTSPTTCTRG